MYTYIYIRIRIYIYITYTYIYIYIHTYTAFPWTLQVMSLTTAFLQVPLYLDANSDVFDRDWTCCSRERLALPVTISEWSCFLMYLEQYMGIWCKLYRYGSIPINTIFRGMNIHLPAILMFTRGTRFWHTAILNYIHLPSSKGHLWGVPHFQTQCNVWIDLGKW